ncbi:MAG TPA: hypothetical protein VHA13_00940 [Gammaproteobacteria bacterium]|nr:hypothetical protein [Gammaproteobacteria bacterium]
MATLRRLDFSKVNSGGLTVDEIFAVCQVLMCLDKDSFQKIGLAWLVAALNLDSPNFCTSSHDAFHSLPSGLQTSQNAKLFFEADSRSFDKAINHVILDARFIEIILLLPKQALTQPTIDRLKNYPNKEKLQKFLLQPKGLIQTAQQFEALCKLSEADLDFIMAEMLLNKEISQMNAATQEWLKQQSLIMQYQLLSSLKDNLKALKEIHDNQLVKSNVKNLKIYETPLAVRTIMAEADSLINSAQKHSHVDIVRMNSIVSHTNQIVRLMMSTEKVDAKAARKMHADYIRLAKQSPRDSVFWSKVRASMIIIGGALLVAAGIAACMFVGVGGSLPVVVGFFACVGGVTKYQEAASKKRELRCAIEAVAENMQPVLQF